MAKLSSSLVLNKYILFLFGVTDLEALSKDLKDSSLEGYDENNVSHLHHALVAKLYHNDNLTKELLLQYDQNIFSHTQIISKKRNEPIRWKYFQYMALLFTEIYLDKYFTDKIGLQSELNNFLVENNGKYKNDFSAVSKFKLENDSNDLNKIAYWNATGSGKTLLMHINIQQYLYYLKLHNVAAGLNRIIVLTPNEGLSKQHLKEFALSDMDAELFNKTGGTLFASHKIEIIDIHKLEETSGKGSVAIESFEGNNLVLVDEGHRGTSGTGTNSWKDKRNRLCDIGFSFEYSATFGQAVHALSGKKQKELLDEYGKATIFDYSYRYFYNDGYGKDYQILNLNEQWHESGKEDRVQLYLTACLLSFYEQLLVYRDHKSELDTFLVDKPLAIFVGGKVTSSISKEIASDVVEVLKFLAFFVKNENTSTERIKLLLEAKDGLNDEYGHSIFRNSYREIIKKGNTAVAVFQDIMKEIFNSEVAGAYLHIDNLKGQDGEIGLRIGNAKYFGVINVGDDKGLLKICEAHNLLVDDKDFSDSLFQKINSKHSTINVLIGSKKFTEGWSSWRVSTMGLLNIGRGEGSEIIQLFGRGVRLKGYKFSLQRSTALDPNIKPTTIPAVLPILETLNIFGLRADYMQQFKDYLEEEGLKTQNDDDNYERFKIEILPTITKLSDKKLKTVQVKEGANFKKDDVVEAIISDKVQHVILDWYPKIQVLNSKKKAGTPDIVSLEKCNFSEANLAFIDWMHIYFEIQKFKNERSWYNLNLSKAELEKILACPDWYTIYIPSAELTPTDFSKVRMWQELAITLLKLFIERLYNYKKRDYYKDKLETMILDATHPNFNKEYNILVQKDQERIISKLKGLQENVRKKNFKENFEIGQNFEALYSAMHLYQPLIYIESGDYKEVVKIQPVALNKGERDFVEDLKIYFENNSDFFVDKQLYLLRNESRKGIGFFEANGNFYPDFILWLVIGEMQYISFIDPKGLRQIQGIEDPKIQLHKTIKTTIQAGIQDSQVLLNSFIISNTPYNELIHWKGQENITDFNSNHVYFQKEQKSLYIESMIKSMVKY